MSLGADPGITLKEKAAFVSTSTSTYRLSVGASGLGGMTKKIIQTSAPDHTKPGGNQHRAAPLQQKPDTLIIWVCKDPDIL